MSNLTNDSCHDAIGTLTAYFAYGSSITNRAWSVRTDGSAAGSCSYFLKAMVSDRILPGRWYHHSYQSLVLQKVESASSATVSVEMFLLNP